MFNTEETWELWAIITQKVRQLKKRNGGKNTRKVLRLYSIYDKILPKTQEELETISARPNSIEYLQNSMPGLMEDISCSKKVS